MASKQKTKEEESSSALRRLCLLLFFLLASVGLMACGGNKESNELQDAIDIGSEDVVSLQIVSEEGKSLFEDGERWQFTVNALRADGTSFEANERVQWSTGDSRIASIDSKGQFTAAAVAGSLATEVIVRWGPLSSAFSVTVSDAKLMSIVTSVQSNPIEECLATSLHADGVYSDGSNRALTDVAWSVSNSTLARTEGSTFYAQNSGNVDLSASRSNLNSTPLAIVITDSLVGIRFNRGTNLNARIDESLQLQSIGDYADGEVDITAATRWRSADQSLITVSDSGLLKALNTGETTVSADCGGLVATLSVTVIDVDDISIVDPEDADMSAGDSRQLELYRVFSDGTFGSEDIADDGDVVWDIDSGDEIASIDSGEVKLVDDLSDFEDSFIRVFAEYEGFEDTLIISLDK